VPAGKALLEQGLLVCFSWISVDRRMSSNLIALYLVTDCEVLKAVKCDLQDARCLLVLLRVRFADR
jgi:hypothetical protein